MFQQNKPQKNGYYSCHLVFYPVRSVFWFITVSSLKCIITNTVLIKLHEECMVDLHYGRLGNNIHSYK
jgi:hypothetical protein